MTQTPVLNDHLLDQIAKSGDDFRFTFANNTFSDPDVINSFPNLIIFGDSLSDTGNIFQASGNTFPPSPPYFPGRFSDGPIWLDYLAPKLEFSQESIINFAFAGANTGISNNFADITVPGLLTQIQQFTNEITTNSVIENSLYIIWVGANNFLTLPADPVQAVTEAVSNISSAITTLNSSGAENIVIANLTDLGGIPAVINNGNSANARAISIAFNNSLSQTIDNLETALSIDLSLVDIFALSRDVQVNPENYNITNLTEPLINATGTVNPDEYAYFDEIHPTTKIHQLVSQTFAETLVEEAIIPDLITYSATLADGSKLPDWLEFNPITRTFDGTPTDDNLGILDIKVTATDQENLAATDIFSLVIERTTPAIVAGTPDADNKIAGVNFDGINNTIFTGAGKDEVDIPLGGSLAGNNRIATGSDNDIIFVSNRDRAFGGSGDDELDATNASKYRLSGGSGNDTFYLGENGRALGGDGDDQFFVQEGGNNVMAGGAGADKFWVANVSLPMSKNTITDFTIGVDKIHFSGFENLNFEGINREQMGADTLLKLDTMEVALLVGINANSITANDFEFVASVV
jgi:phospholipase/lecithinase/hemolysin